MAFGSDNRLSRAAASLLPAGSQILGITVGAKRFTLNRMAFICMSIVGVLSAICLAFDLFLAPVILTTLIFVKMCKPSRVLVVARNGVAVLDTSTWTAKPTKLLALLPPDALKQMAKPPTARKVFLFLNGESIVLRRKHYERVAGVISVG